MAKFTKGGRRPPNAGRKRGSRNKTTKLLKEAIELAAERTGDPTNGGRGGLVEYLCFLAREFPPTFASLLARALPLQVQLDGQTEVIYRTVEEIDRDIASRGFSIQELGQLLLEARPTEEKTKEDKNDDDSAAE